MTRDSVSVRPNAFRCPVVATVIDSFFSDVPENKFRTTDLPFSTYECPTARWAALSVGLRRGSRHESASESGPAHFIEHRVFKGTARRSQAQIAQGLDEIGGQSDAFTSQEHAGFQAKMLGEHVPRALDLLFDIVLAPRFDAEELERVRMVIFEEKGDR